MRYSVNFQKIIKVVAGVAIIFFGIVLLIKMNIIEINKMFYPDIVPNCIKVVLVCNQTEYKICKKVVSNLRELGIKATIIDTIPYTTDSDMIIIYNQEVISDIELNTLKKMAKEGKVVVFAKGSGIAKRENNSIVYVGLGPSSTIEKGVTPDLMFDYVIENGKPQKIKAHLIKLTNPNLFRYCRGEITLNETIYNYKIYSTDVDSIAVLSTSIGDLPAMVVQKYGSGYIVLAPFDIFKDPCIITGLIRYTCANKFFLCSIGL